MGKTDARQSKLTFENKRQTRQGDVDPETAQGRADDTDAENANLRILLLEVKSSLKTIDSKLDSMSARLDQVKTQVDTHELRLDQLENRQTEAHKFQVDTKEQMLNMERVFTVIRAKNDDVEARSRRNNIHLVGILETTAIGKMEHFVEELLQDIFGSDYLKCSLWRGHTVL